MSLRENIPAFKGFRQLPEFGKGLLTVGNVVQVLLKVSEPSFVDHLVKKFKAELPAFSLRSDGRHWIPVDPNTTVVHEIPSGMRSLPEVDHWFINEVPPNTADRLGVIAANKDTVAVAMNHIVGDGKFVVGVIDHLFDPIKPLTSPYPADAGNLFSEEIRSFRMPRSPWADTELTRFFERNPRGPVEVPYVMRTNASTMSCYDPQKKACHQLTEALWTLSVLSISTFFGGSDYLAPLVCVDIRPFMKDEMKRKKDLTYCNIFTVMGVHAKSNWKKKTLGECYKMIREDLKSRIQKREYLDYVAGQIIPTNDFIPLGQTFVSSHLGVVKIREPVSDVYISNYAYFEVFSHLLQILSYSIVDEQKGRNELVTFMRHGCDGVTFEEADVINKTLQYGLQKFTLDMPMERVLKEIETYQKHLISSRH